MEKQKVFWVVLSVSVFVVVVLLVGVLLLRQQPASAAGPTAGPATGTGAQPYEYQRQTPPAPSATGPLAGTPPAGEQQTMHFYVGEGAPGASAQGSTPAPGAAAPSAAAPGAGIPASPSSQVSASPAAPAAPLAAGPHAPVAQSSKTRAAKTAVAARAPRRTADYWIQAGSYKSQTKAEELVSLLENKGLGGRVFSYQSKSDTFYRVRVGPYSHKGEADKFLALVRQVQGLEASFVSMVRPARSAVN